MKNKTIPFLFILLFPTLCCAEETETTFQFLQKFHQDPKHMMERLPSIVDENNIAHTRGYIDRNDLEWQRVVKSRIDARERIFTDTSLNVLSAATAPMTTQLVEPGPILNNPLSMEQQHLTKALISPTPWADSYWPIYQGLAAARYADPNAPRSSSWNANFAYFQSNPPETALGSTDKKEIDQLSPAEKYDILLGDMSFSLTNYSWGLGEYYMRTNQEIPTWMGICHGWAGASSMNMPIPKKPNVFQSVSGQSVTLYPADIKALESMLWANAIKPNRVQGTRCNQVNPAVDAHGRIIDPACFDVSPSDWHEAVVNQVGIYQRSFVMDGDYDIQVWNYPIVSYSYRYFNPQSWQQAASLAGAIIPISSFTVDKFSQYRSPQAKYIVGIEMDVSYVIEIQPTVYEILTPPTKTVRYMYDLELDADQNIIGTGEWYQNAHPDFLWTFDKDTQAHAPEDNEISNDVWDTSTPVPSSWTRRAQAASSRGIPLQSFLGKVNQ